MAASAFAFLAAGVVIIAASAWLGGPGSFDTLGTPGLLFFVGIACAMLGLGLGIAQVRQYRRATRRFETALHAALAGETALNDPPREFDPGLARLWRMAGALSRRSAHDVALKDRLAGVLAAIPQPVIVLTENMLVSLANKAASDLLGYERLKIGTSILDAVNSESLDALLRSAGPGTAAAGQLRLVNDEWVPARAQTLPAHGGWVLLLEAGSAGGAGLIEAMELHAPVPPRIAPTPQTPLEQLTVMVLDCESTGLNVGFDRLLSLAAVRVQGTKLVRGETIDVLFDPGEPIPAASTAIHGITDAMAMAERPLAERWPEIEPMLGDCVIVGHNIGFDLTLLEIELRRAGIRWHRPASLCTVQLAAALDPSLTDLNLEAVAQAYGIPVAGRHTALGDALVTAELYLHLLASLQSQGGRTLADAQARAATARRVIREQQAAGW